MTVLQGYTPMTNTFCACGEPTEWIDIYCQECWEQTCSDSWWEMLNSLTPKTNPMLVLIKLAGTKATCIFLAKDITRITPILVGSNLEGYALELTREHKSIHLSPQQFDRLIPFLGYIDLSRDLDEELPTVLDEEFEEIIGELLDRAIKSPSIRPL
jgi:hypothetical protein